MDTRQSFISLGPYQYTYNTIHHIPYFSSLCSPSESNSCSYADRAGELGLPMHRWIHTPTAVEVKGCWNIYSHLYTANVLE